MTAVHHHYCVVQIDLAALRDNPDALREVVPELQAEKEKLLQLIQRVLRHGYGPRSEKLDLDQLQLVLEDKEQSAAESDAANDTAEPPQRRLSAAKRPMCAGAFVSCEVGHWSRACTFGCRTTCRACRAGLTWQRPRDMRCANGTG